MSRLAARGPPLDIIGAGSRARRCELGNEIQGEGGGGRILPSAGLPSVWGGIFWVPAPHPFIPPGYSTGDGPWTCLLWHSGPSGRLGGTPIGTPGVKTSSKGPPPDDFGLGAEHMRGIPVRRC